MSHNTKWSNFLTPGWTSDLAEVNFFQAFSSVPLQTSSPVSPVLFAYEYSSNGMVALL